MVFVYKENLAQLVTMGNVEQYNKRIAIRVDLVGKACVASQSNSALQGRAVYQLYNDLF